MSKVQKIVVVGGGAAGVLVAQGLSAAFDQSRVSIKLVTERNYNIHVPALLRTIVTAEGNFETRALNPYDRVFKPGKVGEVVVSRVTSISDTNIHTEDGQTIPYDYLVLATGTKWSGPLNFPNDLKEAHNWVAEWRRKFQEANNIVLIGGGAVGTELSGEIKYYLPSKQVTVIHNQLYLTNDNYPTHVRKYGTEKTRNIGVNVIVNDRADMPKGDYTSITTEKGVKLDADLVVPTWGGKLNTDVIKVYDASVVTEAGAVRVLPTLQVQGKPNVYAVGDIIDWHEQKMLAKAAGHAAVVIANITSQIKGEQPTKPYTGFMGGKEAILMPLGPKKGFGYIPILWGIVVGDWIAWMLKSRTLFVELAQKMMGYA